MTLGVAILLATILYLIDKNKVWKQAAKVTLVLVIVGVLGVAGLYGWSKFSDWRQQKKEQAEAAAQAAEEAKALEAQHAEHAERVKNCIATRKAAYEKGKQAWNEAEETKNCESNPDEYTSLPPGFVLDAPQIDFRSYQPVQRPTSKPHAKMLRAKLNADLDTTEWGSLVCGHVAEGELVTLLVDDGSQVKVRTKQGSVGWGGSYYFEVSDH